MSLLPHNIPVFEELVEKMNKSRYAIIITATGTGKSYLAEEYIRTNNLRALVVVPRRTLVNYWNNLSDQIIATSYSYFTRHVSEFLENKNRFDIAIFDEAHHAGAKKWGEAVTLFKVMSGLPIIGLTADSKRYSDGGRDVADEIWEGNTVKGYSLIDALESGILPSITYHYALYKNPEMYENILDGISDRLLKRLEYCLENTMSCADIIRTETDNNTAHKGVVFVDNIESIESGVSIIKDAFPDENIWYIHSKQSNRLNDLYLSEFNNSESGYIVTVNMLNEGIHTSGVDTVIMLRKTSSPTIYFQQIGRACSVNGKPIQIFDFVSNRIGMKITSNRDDVIYNLFGNKAAINKVSDQIIYKDHIGNAIEIFKQIEEELSNKWTEEEDDIIREYYPTEGSKVVDRLPNRTKNACMTRAYILGIKAPSKTWTKEEDDIIREYYPIEGLKVADRLPGRSRESCMNRAIRLDIKVLSKDWTKEEDDILMMYYPIEGSKVVDRLPGRTQYTCKSRASRLGIKILSRVWTEEEEDILMTYYPIEGSKVVDRLPGKTLNGCIHKANKLGIKAPSKDWTKEEDVIIREYYPTEGSKVADRLPGRSKGSCTNRAMQLRINATFRKDWTKEEDDIFREYYPTEGSKVTDRLPGRNRSACKSRAIVLNIKAPSKTWTKEEDDIIREYYPTEGSKVTDRLPGRSKGSCTNRAKRLDIVSQSKDWTKEEDDILMMYYPIEGLKVANRLPGRTIAACRHRANVLGITKN